MHFKFGVYGFEQSELANACRSVLNGPTTFREMKFRNNFVEFSTEKFWKGLGVVNEIALSLDIMHPEKFDSSKTRIWVDGDILEIFLVDKVRIAESAMRQASRLLRQGRSKKKELSNDLARQARLTLDQTLKALQL